MKKIGLLPKCGKRNLFYFSPSLEFRTDQNIILGYSVVLKCNVQYLSLVENVLSELGREPP